MNLEEIAKTINRIDCTIVNCSCDSCENDFDEETVGYNCQDLRIADWHIADVAAAEKRIIEKVKDYFFSPEFDSLKFCEYLDKLPENSDHAADAGEGASK